MNTDASWPAPEQAQARVLEIQAKLHRWAIKEPGRRFDDLFNLVHDPAFVTVAWMRVKTNRGGRSAGVDGETAKTIRRKGEQRFLTELREHVKTRSFVPVPVRQRMIPKAGGTVRGLGIPTVTDRVVQAALKLVLEPIFEADFQPCSYGFRPRRRAQDAIEEIHQMNLCGYHWVLEADIESCFDTIDHRVPARPIPQRWDDDTVTRCVRATARFSCDGRLLAGDQAASRAVEV